MAFTNLSSGFRRCLTCVVLVSICLPASAADWPQWRGPDRNGISRETGWSTVWPQEGPPALWKAAVGIGFSSVSVSQGSVYTMGNADGHDTVFSFDEPTGKVHWKYSYPCGLRPQFYEGGTSSTPTVDGTSVYTLSKEGQLFAFDTATGKIRWQTNLVQDVGATLPRWCFSGSALVQNDLLILNVGPAGTAVEKDSGRVTWFSGKGPSGYATPVPITLAGQRCVLIFSAKALVCVAVQDGRKLWQYPWVTKWDLNVADPIVQGDQVLISSFDQGSALLKVTTDGVTEIWRNQNLAAHFANPVLFEGHVYGVHGNTDRPPAELRCIEFATGDLNWKQTGLGFGALSIVNGHLLVVSDKGELVVAPANPKQFVPHARAQVLGGKCWITPVLSNQRVYCRNAQGTLVCLDLHATK